MEYSLSAIKYLPYCRKEVNNTVMNVQIHELPHFVAQSFLLFLVLAAEIPLNFLSQSDFHHKQKGICTHIDATVMKIGLCRDIRTELRKRDSASIFARLNIVQGL